MVSPIDPVVCETTGRLLTEWFEFPEYDDKQLWDEALKAHGLTEKPRVPVSESGSAAWHMQAQVNAFVSRRKQVKFSNNMSKNEVQARLNEATKMVNPDNYKFLNDDVRERTGLEINPLWMMECLVRSGVLSAKEQMAGLRDLAQYTHSKAATVQHNTNTELSSEDWLLELAKEEYKVIDSEKPMRQPLTPAERGSGKNYESNMKKKAARSQDIQDYANSRLAALEAELDADFEDLGDGE
jgi:hypothetical protein